MTAPLRSSFDVYKHPFGKREMWECTFSCYGGASKSFFTDPIRIDALVYHCSVDDGWTVHLHEVNETYNTSVDHLLSVEPLSKSGGYRAVTGPSFSTATSTVWVPPIASGVLQISMSSLATNSGQGGVVKIYGTTEW